MMNVSCSKKETQGQLKRAVFLDRDGVVNKDTNYPCNPTDIIWVDGARQAIAELNGKNYYVFIITNQSGIARGLYTENNLVNLHEWMQSQFAEVGGHVDAFYYCPHHPVHGVGKYHKTCKCRKPEPGMILQAMSEWPVERSGSFLIGDKDSDLQAAKAAGIVGHLFEGGNLLNYIELILKVY